jgi:ABC-type branched-subunit amino acid transport system substrate-binding protein
MPSEPIGARVTGMLRTRLMLFATLTGSLVMASLATSAAGASTPGVTANSITLGLITELTGPGAAPGTGMVQAAQARIDEQNAKGGIYGRKIKLIVEDDQTNPETDKTASALLISKGVFGVIDDSAVTFGGYKLFQQAGVPVTGGGYDGPEWFEQPDTNMFSISGPADAKDPQYSNSAVFAKEHGGTKCASLGYGISPSSQASATGFMLACQREGLQKTFLDTTVPFGTEDVTSLILQIKESGANVLWLPLDGDTNSAIMTGLGQAGVKMKVIINATGYGQQLLDDTNVIPDAQGAWFLGEGVPVEFDTPGTKAFQAGLAKYAHFTGIPDFTWYEGWGGADLMIEGLELAGKDPTQSAFITDLHKVTDYSGNGLFGPVSFSLSDFGKAPKTLCEDLVQLEGDKYVHPTQVCGTLLPNSDQLPSA